MHDQFDNLIRSTLDKLSQYRETKNLSRHNAIAGFKSCIDNQYQNTRKFKKIIEQYPDFNCPYTPESNILCFQYTKFGTTNDFQLAIQNEIVKRGNFYITSSEVRGKRYLRLTVINPLTKAQHIHGLVQETRSSRSHRSSC